MALWNQVVTDFNSLDETINFGTRAFAESDDCIYESTTLATIDPDCEVFQPTKLNSLVNLHMS